MYEKLLRQMQRAARAGKVIITRHAFRELEADDLTPEDAIHCILTGEIVKDQFDPDYQQMKYVIFGDSLDEDEMGVIARLDVYQNAVVITAYRLRIDDYE